MFHRGRFTANMVLSAVVVGTAGTAAAVTAAITAAAALSSAAEAGTEGKRQPDAQGRQDQNFQHGSLLYPSSSAAMW